MAIVLTDSQNLSSAEIEAIKAAAVDAYLAANPAGTIVTQELLTTIRDNAVAAYISTHPVISPNFLAAKSAIIAASQALVIPQGGYTLSQLNVLADNAIDAYIAANNHVEFNDEELFALHQIFALYNVFNQSGIVLTDAEITALNVSYLNANRISPGYYDIANTAPGNGQNAVYPANPFSFDNALGRAGGFINTFLSGRPDIQLTDIESRSVAYNWLLTYLNRDGYKFYNDAQVAAAHPFSSGYYDIANTAPGNAQRAAYPIDPFNYGYVLSHAVGFMNTFLAGRPDIQLTDIETKSVFFNWIDNFLNRDGYKVYSDSQITDVATAAVSAYLAAHPGTIYTDAQITILTADAATAAVAAYVAAHPGTSYTDAQIAVLTSDAAIAAVAAYVAAHPGTNYTDAQIVVLQSDAGTAAVAAYIAAHPGTNYTDAQIAVLTSDAGTAAVAAYIAAHPGTNYTDAQIAVITSDAGSAAVAAYVAAHPGTIYTDAEITALNDAAITAYLAAHDCHCDTVYTPHFQNYAMVDGHLDLNDNHTEDIIYSEYFDQYAAKNYTVKGEAVTLRIVTNDKHSPFGLYPVAVVVDGAIYNSTGDITIGPIPVHTAIEIQDAGYALP
jgi:multisubunit Na+/H+ antiporter MnhE subunit